MVQHATTPCIERRTQVTARCGFQRTTLHESIRAGTFTPALSIGKRAVGWPSHEVDALINARIAGRTDDEIRALVAKLVAARKEAA